MVSTSSTERSEDVGADERARLTRVLVVQARDATDPRRQAELLDRVVLLNQRVARAVAARYRGRGVADDDLEQAAYEGLVKAVARFDPSVREDLLTYAVPTIRGEVQRSFRDHAWMVRPPRRLQELQLRVARASGELAGELGREPSSAELCERVGIGAGEYDETLRSFGCFRPASLDQPVRATSEVTLGDTLADATATHDGVEARVVTAALLDRLGPRDRLVIRRRFFDGCSQHEIGLELGVTQAQVSRIITRVLRELRRQV